MALNSLQEVRVAATTLPGGDDAAAEAVARRQKTLTKPKGSLGRLETAVAWLAKWQRREMPKLDRVKVVVFAGSHGVTAQGVSAYPADVTGQMVQNFVAGGAAINQLSRVAGAELAVVPLEVDRPTADFTREPAMTDVDFLAAVRTGWETVDRNTDLICFGEMGIGNTTAAAALSAALFGGDISAWAGRGTGVDDAGLERKIAAIDRALARHRDRIGDPLELASALGGRELAAILGGTLAARQLGVPVLLDGFVCTAAVAPLAQLHSAGLAHTLAGHVSAEAGHRGLLGALGLQPLLDLGMRLGEGSGACLAVNILRSALECHRGMASFAEAGVSEKQRLPL